MSCFSVAADVAAHKLAFISGLCWHSFILSPPLPSGWHRMIFIPATPALFCPARPSSLSAPLSTDTTTRTCPHET